MIVPEDKKVSGIDTAMSGSHDSPPPYSEATSELPLSSGLPLSSEHPLSSELPESSEPPSGSSTSATRPSPRPRPANLTASNFVKIKRKDSSVKGTYVIDPWLYVPEDILAASASPEDEEGDDAPRKNLYLESKNGSVKADVWLVDEEAAGYPRDAKMEGKKAQLEFRSRECSVNVKLESTTAQPFDLTAHSRHDYVSVGIPPDFIGPVTITAVNYYASFPGSMKERLVTFSEEKGTRHCFIGDFRKAGYTGRQDWAGSTIDIGSYDSKVILYFVDEEKNCTGFWNKAYWKLALMG